MTYQGNQVNSLNMSEIKPLGWLKDQLTLQLEGISLHLDENWGSVGPFSDWIGGTDNSWERPPYWLDGLVPLVYVLDHQEGIAKVKKWIDWSIQSQRENGDFGPSYRKIEFDDTLFWPKFVMLKAIISYYEAEKDERVFPFMTKYFQFCTTLLDEYQMDGWAQARAGDFAYCIYWLYEHTKEEWLLTLVEKVNRQALDWTGFLENLPFTQPTKYYYDWHLMDENVSRWHLYDVMKYHATHIVNVTMGLKQPLMEYKRTGEKKYLDAIYTGMQSLMNHHGQVTGIYSGDEHLSGLAPTQGSELCSVVEFMFSLQLIFEVSGDTRFLDLLERITYNALPATISEDFKAHQYDQQANQVKVSMEKRNWYNNGDRANVFGFEPNFGCCLANMHQGWPKFVKNAILTSKDHIVVGVYMPIETSFTFHQCKVCIQEETKYPFHDVINFHITVDQATTLPMKFRVPSWCKAPILRCEGEQLEACIQDGYLICEVAVATKTTLSLQLPMEVTLCTNWYHHGLSVERGPLIYALNIQEQWNKLPHGHTSYPDYEILAQSDWNYAINVREEIRVCVNDELAQQAFSKEHAPVRLYAKASCLPEWTMQQNSAGDLPISPVQTKGESVEIELVPYGCTKLRIALFPWY